MCSPSLLAKSVVYLFGGEYHDEVIYSWDGKFLEVNKAEGGLLQAADDLLPNVADEERVMLKMKAALAAGEIKM